LYVRVTKYKNIFLIIIKKRKKNAIFVKYNCKNKQIKKNYFNTYFIILMIIINISPISANELFND
jgi:hypothetical protein